MLKIADPSSIIKNYETDYQDGWNRLDKMPKKRFTFKVMLAVQKHWKHFQTRGTCNITKYYDTVMALDEAYRLFLCKYYTEIQSFSKKLGGRNKQPQEGELKIKKGEFLGKN